MKPVRDDKKIANVIATSFDRSKDENAAFPLKLRKLLNDVESNGSEQIVSWLSDGNSFRVNRRRKFVNKILPKYFKQTCFKSFQRQLYFYGFVQIKTGHHRGAYFHPLFKRHDRDSTALIRRIDGKKRKAMEANSSKFVSNNRSDHSVDNPRVLEAALFTKSNNVQNESPSMSQSRIASKRHSDSKVQIYPQSHVSATPLFRKSNSKSCHNSFMNNNEKERREKGHPLVDTTNIARLHESLMKYCVHHQEDQGFDKDEKGSNRKERTYDWIAILERYL